MFRNPEWPLFSGQAGLRTLGNLPNLSLVEFKVFKPGLPRDMEELDQACARRVSEHLFSKNGIERRPKVWLFLAHTGWTRKSGAWITQEMSSFPSEWRVEQLPRAYEVLVESDKGIRFAGLAEVDAESFQTATRILRKHQSSCIIMSDRADIASSSSIKLVFGAAFTAEDQNVTRPLNWARLSLALCPLGDVLLRVSGSYDERMATLDCIMVPERTVLFE